MTCRGEESSCGLKPRKKAKCTSTLVLDSIFLINNYFKNDLKNQSKLFIEMINHVAQIYYIRVYAYIFLQSNLDNSKLKGKTLFFDLKKIEFIVF